MTLGVGAPKVLGASKSNGGGGGSNGGGSDGDVLQVEARAPRSVLDQLARHQGGFVEGEAAKALDQIALAIRSVVQDVARGKLAADAKEGGLAEQSKPVARRRHCMHALRRWLRFAQHSPTDESHDDLVAPQHWTHWGRHYEEFERDLSRTEVMPYLKGRGTFVGGTACPACGPGPALCRAGAGA